MRSAWQGLSYSSASETCARTKRIAVVYCFFSGLSRDTCRVIALNLPASISYKFSSIWLLIIGSVSPGEIYLWPLIAVEDVVILRLPHWPKARSSCKFFHFLGLEKWRQKIQAHKEIMRHENLLLGRIPKALYALSKFTNLHPPIKVSSCSIIKRTLLSPSMINPSGKRGARGLM